MTNKLLLFAAFVVSMLLMSMNHRKRKKRVVFFGDSITELGTQYDGYIKVLQQGLQELGIEDDYQLVNAGVSGDQVYDLYLRMDEDVLAKGAEIVVIFIGINDVGHKFSSLTGTDMTKFDAFYTAIIKRLMLAEIKVVLCTPAVIGETPNFATEEDEEIEKYCDVIRSLALKFELPIVDLRKAFLAYNVVNNHEYKDEGILTTDRVHLNRQGNQLVAKEIWKVLKEISVK